LGDNVHKSLISFNPRACEGATAVGDSQKNKYWSFNPRACEGATLVPGLIELQKLFQSTRL